MSETRSPFLMSTLVSYCAKYLDTKWTYNSQYTYPLLTRVIGVKCLLSKYDYTTVTSVDTYIYACHGPFTHFPLRGNKGKLTGQLQAKFNVHLRTYLM